MNIHIITLHLLRRCNMRRMIQFSVLLITVFVMLIISCNMPSDPFKKPSNSKVRLFSEKNEQTIKFGSEVMIGVSIFLAEHIEALHASVPAITVWTLL